MKNLPWDREKDSKTVWHTVKPWELRHLCISTISLFAIASPTWACALFSILIVISYSFLNFTSSLLYSSSFFSNISFLFSARSNSKDICISSSSSYFSIFSSRFCFSASLVVLYIWHGPLELPWSHRNYK